MKSFKEFVNVKEGLLSTMKDMLKPVNQKVGGVPKHKDAVEIFFGKPYQPNNPDSGMSITSSSSGYLLVDSNSISVQDKNGVIRIGDINSWKKLQSNGQIKATSSGWKIKIFD